MADGEGPATLFPHPLVEEAINSGTIGKVATGVLPYQQLAQMCKAGQILALRDIEASQLQPASVDLRLGRYAYQVRASFLPGKNSDVLSKVKQMDGETPLDLSDGAVFERGAVYVVELMEHIKLPSTINGYANPKSSTGRLDVLTRLITDNSTAFDQIQSGYEGKLYIEIAPQTFNIIVRQGSRLNQVRFQRGTPVVSGGDLRGLYNDGQLVRSDAERQPILENLVPVTIDLKGDGRGSVIGYRAKKHTRKIDVDRVGEYDPHEFWERLVLYDDTGLILDPDEFYVLATCEEVGVPPRLAAEMVPYVTRSGEYRVHYAGFFDPGFGWDERAIGSRAVLEVRSHEVPFMLEHGQIVGWLRYLRMAEAPTKVYGSRMKSSYQGQRLALSKHFKPFGR